MTSLAFHIKTNSEHVREFTGEAGQPIPEKPTPMNQEETKFIAKMILDSTMELMTTHWGPAEAKAILKSFIDSSIFPKRSTLATAINQCADQADALVDVYYYSQNAACKKGMNLSSVFSMVHTANMAKRDPATGKFMKREDGKIIKPKGPLPTWRKSSRASNARDRGQRSAPSDQQEEGKDKD